MDYAKQRLCLFVLFGMIAVGFAEQSTDEKKSLEREVAGILRQSNVDIRGDIEKVFALGDIYFDDKNYDKAMYYYLEGLKSNAWNLPYQVKTANLLHQKHRDEEALEKAKLVYDFAEKEELIEQAVTLMKELGHPIEKDAGSQPESNMTIMLVPIGDVNRHLLDETIQDLQATLGVRYIINDNINIKLGNPERSHASRYINHIFNKMREDFTDAEFKEYRIKAGILITDLEGYENLKNFVLTVFKENNIPEDELKQFQETLSKMEKEGQYHATRLLHQLRTKGPSTANPPIMGCIGITSEDIYDSDYNFLFGQSMSLYAVMSYHRFTAEFNDEIPNRQRLKERTVRQLLSSSFFVFDIPRCSNPTCARAYPNSLEEHDRKDNKPCASCLEKWKKQLNDIKP